MRTKSRSIQQIIEEQVQRWQLIRAEKFEEMPGTSIITISESPAAVAV